MMDFYYVNSNGRVIDLSKPPFLGEKSNNLFEFKWDYITQGQAVQKIVKFEKYMVQKKFNVLISGETDRDYYSNLEKFLQWTDVDINNLKMGRLYVGKYFLDCYIFASGKKKKYLGTHKTLVECSIICERGNWQSEKMFRYTPAGAEQETTGYGFVYPYDYDYDYSAPYTGTTLLNESYMDTDFEMIFYGADLLPEITIGGNDYRVNYELEAGDYLVINSKDKTVRVTKNNGEVVNVFMYRDRDWNIFEKIKGGGNFVLRDDTTTCDIKLFYERSEPKWSDEIWT
jgi:hypothetical protein